MKKQLPAIVLGIACVVLAIAYINSNNTVKQLQHDLAQLNNRQNGEPEASEISTISGGIPMDAAAVDSTNPADALAAVDAAVEEKAAGSRRMMENVAKMMENPTMNKVMEASQRGAVAALYTDLIEYLNLGKEETDYFMDLLMYRQMKQIDLGMKMMSGTLSEEEKETLAQDIEAANDLVKEQMKKFLNNEEDFAEFEYYEDTVGERMLLSQMDKDLSGTGAALSDTTYRQLLGVMHDERENFDFTSDLQDQENTDLSPERFSRDNLQNYANDIQNLNDAICLKAKGILTPEQYDAFVASLKSFTDMQLAQLEMAAQMFGAGE